MSAVDPHRGQGDSALVQELRRTLARLELALAQISDGLAITDGAGLLLWCNLAFEQLLGRSRLFLLGQPLLELLQAQLPAAACQELVAALRSQPQGGALNSVVAQEPLQVLEIEWRPVQSEQPSPTVLSFHDVTDRVSLEQQRQRSQELQDQQLALAAQVVTCPVTGLPNRRGLSLAIADAVQRLHRHPGWLAVLFCDLNRFKEVNDTYGHRVGDQLLIELAQRMKAVLRPEDVLARLGGDEFVVLCTDLQAPAGAMEVAERLLAAVARPWTPSAADLTVDIHPQMSVGIALCSDSSQTPDQLLHDADLAMYEAKKARQQQPIVVFDAAISAQLERRLLVRRRLEQSLQTQTLPIHFQPVVCLSSGRVLGFEALARPQDSQGAAIPPEQFIAVAESSGLIAPLGQLVFEESLAAAHAQGILQRGFSVAVNVSPQQLAVAGLASEVIRIAERHHCPPSQLSIEVTETALIDQPQRTREELAALRQAGFRVLLDDFGVGYSSLSWLAELPIDGLKIDRSFTATMLEDRRRHALIAAIIRLAADLQLEVVAEGIERADQLRALRDLGCRLGQGYVFSPPRAQALLHLPAARLPPTPC